jgi:hypothetical protein
MVRRRSTVRFRKEAHECKHEKRHSNRTRAYGVALALSGCLGSICHAGIDRDDLPQHHPRLVTIAAAGHFQSDGLPLVPSAPQRQIGPPTRRGARLQAERVWFMRQETERSMLAAQRIGVLQSGIEPARSPNDRRHLVSVMAAFRRGRYASEIVRASVPACSAWLRQTWPMTSEPFGQPAKGAEIWIICGNACAGKTTTARLLAQRLPLAAHVEGDEMQRLIVSGRPLRRRRSPRGRRVRRPGPGRRRRSAGQRV